jgi:hypothetical protein
MHRLKVSSRYSTKRKKSPSESFNGLKSDLEHKAAKYQEQRAREQLILCLELDNLSVHAGSKNKK